MSIRDVDNAGPAAMTSASAVPLVAYLALEPRPHLVASECEQCGARFFDKRIACAACSGNRFRPFAVPAEGTIRTFTIVQVAAPGVKVPFVAAIVDCDGTRVRANLINVPPDPRQVRVGMPVRLATYSLGTDAQGVEAIGFGFEPTQQED